MMKEAIQKIVDKKDLGYEEAYGKKDSRKIAACAQILEPFRKEQCNGTWKVWRIWRTIRPGNVDA